MARAFIIAVYKEILDQEKLKAYAEAAKPVLESYGGKFLARSEEIINLEGKASKRVAMAEFQSKDAAMEYYNSEGYQAALSILEGGVERDQFIVEGVE